MRNCTETRRPSRLASAGESSAPSQAYNLRAHHYSYRIDHDLGFAPHIHRELCTLCGCKTTTIERWAKAGSWVIGTGGKNTGKTDALIYAMKVEKTLSYVLFMKAHPTHAAYLGGRGVSRDAPVLISSHFYYFGDHAPPLPRELSRVVHSTQGCKRLSDRDITLLNKLVLSHYHCGVLGKPNNRTEKLH
jgi:hypothetical protein